MPKTKVCLWISKGGRDCLAHVQRIQPPSTLSSARSDNRHAEMCVITVCLKELRRKKKQVGCNPWSFSELAKVGGKVQRGPVRAQGCPRAPQAAEIDSNKAGTAGLLLEVCSGSIGRNKQG